MCGGLYVWRVPPTKTTPMPPPPIMQHIHTFLRCINGVIQQHFCIYTQYAGINPVLYDTLYILFYNYSLNYTLTNTWARNMQTMQTLYITARPPKTAPNHSISVGLGDLYPHPVNVPTAAQNSQSGGRRIPRIGGI